ncbi:hypothetical protein ACWCRD_02895 [Streptomyces sp. NPDC002092]
MSDSGYSHPASGRLYREGDPAHHFAQLVQALARQCADFQYHYERRLKGCDYLAQQAEWPSDPERIARTMGRTIEQIDKAYTDVVCDRTMHEYGLGKQDVEWQRKYGNVSPEGQS